MKLDLRDLQYLSPEAQIAALKIYECHSLAELQFNSHPNVIKERLRMEREERRAITAAKVEIMKLQADSDRALLTQSCIYRANMLAEAEAEAIRNGYTVAVPAKQKKQAEEEEAKAVEAEIVNEDLFTEGELRQLHYDLEATGHEEVAKGDLTVRGKYAPDKAISMHYNRKGKYMRYYGFDECLRMVRGNTFDFENPEFKQIAELIFTPAELARGRKIMRQPGFKDSRHAAGLIFGWSKQHQDTFYEIIDKLAEQTYFTGYTKLANLEELTAEDKKALYIDNAQRAAWGQLILRSFYFADFKNDDKTIMKEIYEAINTKLRQPLLDLLDKSMIGPNFRPNEFEGTWFNFTSHNDLTIGLAAFAESLFGLTCATPNHYPYIRKLFVDYDDGDFEYQANAMLGQHSQHVGIDNFQFPYAFTNRHYGTVAFTAGFVGRFLQK